MEHSRLSIYNLRLFIALISVVLLFESSIPYIYAEQKTKPENVFLGQIAYMPDQNMYFSFISQAKQGHFALNNKLTSLTPNNHVFINLEFWLVGFIQRITGLSENAIYQVWRYLGILLLTIGIVFLAKTVLPTTRRAVIASTVLLFTGGFGFIVAALNALHLVGFHATQAGIIDMRYGILPFQQMMSNPHFSFPHGLILIAYTFFLLAEKNGKLKHYVWSGVIFNIIALVRPYDILPPIVLLPLYILITSKGKFELANIAKRLLPLFMLIPVFLYNVWLFKVNNIFKYWSSQGHNAGAMPSVFWHYLAFGVVGILAIRRIAQVKQKPLNNAEQFMVLWFGVTFLFIHLGKYFPIIGWSPQIGVYLAVPLGMLAFSADFKLKKPLLYTGTVATALVVLISNVSIILYFAKNFRDESKTFQYYIPKTEMEAWRWMNKNIPEGKVVLALQPISSLIAKYTPANVVVGHYSVTPRYAEYEAEVNNFFRDTIGVNKMPVIKRVNADYLYMGGYEKSMATLNPGLEAYLQKVYSNAVVTIYKVTR